MKSLPYILLSWLLIIVAAVLIFSPKQTTHITEPTLGSVQVGNSYQATTTAQGATAGLYTITSVPGVLGSVVVVSTSAVGGFTVYDATDAGTTTLIALPASTPAGTYTFDTNIFRGLRISVPSGFNGQFITTYRP